MPSARSPRIQSARAATRANGDGHGTIPPITPWRPAASGRGARGRSMRLGWIFATLGIAVAAAIGIGIFALASAPSTNSLHAQVTTLRTQAASLEARLGSLQAQLGTLRNEANASRAQEVALRGEVSSLRSALASEQHTSRTAIASLEKASAGAASINALNGVKGSVHQVQVCVPELQQELSGLKIQTTKRRNGALKSAVLTNPTIVSQDCVSTLTGSSGH
jgi:regulator of replication initiation timing